MKPLFIRTTFLLLEWATWWNSNSICAHIFPKMPHNILKVLMLLVTQENHCRTQCIQQGHHSFSGQTSWVIFNEARFPTTELSHLMIHLPLHNTAVLCQKCPKIFQEFTPLIIHTTNSMLHNWCNPEAEQTCLHYKCKSITERNG